MSDRDGDVLDRAREVDYQRYKRSHPDSTEPGPGAKLALANLMEEFNAAQTTARNEGHEEGFVQGFAKCEALVVLMLSNFSANPVTESLRESVKRLLREDFDPTPANWEGRDWDGNADDVADKLLDLLRTRTLREAAQAVSSGQHQGDTRDPSEILAVHRRIINRSQASKAGRASAASKSREEKVENGKRMAKARWDNKKTEEERRIVLNAYGLMVQTERPLHGVASSYVDVYEGSNKGDTGRAIMGWWRSLGKDPSFIGPSARRRAYKEAEKMIQAWESTKVAERE